MNDFSKILQDFQKTLDSANDTKIVAFITGLQKGLTDDLDKAFASNDANHYGKLLANTKSQGIRVFRNSDGKHKLDMTNFDFSLIGSMLNRI